MLRGPAQGLRGNQAQVGGITTITVGATCAPYRSVTHRSIVMAVVGLAVAMAPALAKPDAGGDPDQPTLTATDLQKYFAPYIPEVKQCYADSTRATGADGRLRLELIIHRDGTVFRFDFVAPGVTGARLNKLDGCLRSLSEKWHFPVRRGFTTAVMPFLFQRVTPADQPKSTCRDHRDCVETRKGARP